MVHRLVLPEGRSLAVGQCGRILGEEREGSCRKSSSPRKTKCELCGKKIRGSGQGYPEPIPSNPIGLCVPCRIASRKIVKNKA